MPHALTVPPQQSQRKAAAGTVAKSGAASLTAVTVERPRGGTGGQVRGASRRRVVCGPSSLVAVALVAALWRRQPGALASKIDDEPELAVEQYRQEAALERQFALMNATYGLGDRRTLEVFFGLFELWIMLYRLNKADAALAEVVPACEWRRDDLTIKAVQAQAFTRWKQGRFREALAGFHEMEGWMGRNAALSENIGHTYNSLGHYDQAQHYFEDALQLIREQPPGMQNNEGGVLLGLAGVIDRRGKHADALPVAIRSYEFYKARDVERGWETSLTAKAGMQVARLHLKLGSYMKAERFARESVRLFKLTAGDDSPLVAGAYERLGAILWRQERREDARQAFHRAYELEAIKDAFDLVSILDVHNQLVETHTSSPQGLDRMAFRHYFPVATRVIARVRAELPQDGNAGAYYKVAGELFVLGADCSSGGPLLAEAVRLFARETVVDTSSLIRQCGDLVAYCDGTYSASGAAV